MNIDSEWYEDVECYCILVIGSSYAISAARDKAIDWVSDDDLYHQVHYQDKLLIKKSAWNSLDNVKQVHIKTYLSGFIDGYDQARVHDAGWL